MLSALADGEATPEDLAQARPHLRSCLPCRARLREYRAVPSRVAALVPPAAVATAGSGDAGPIRAFAESLVGATQDRAAALGERAHQAAELAAGQKVATVASAAAIAAGGGAVGVEKLSERAAAGAAPAADVAPAPKEAVKEAGPVTVAPAPSPTATPTPAAPPSPARALAPAPPPSPRNEFAPDAAAAASGESSPGGGRGGTGGSEFGP